MCQSKKQNKTHLMNIIHIIPLPIPDAAPVITAVWDVNFSQVVMVTNNELMACDGNDEPP